MLDMILIICIVIMAIAGILYLALPSKFIKQDKLKNGESMEDGIKRARKYGIMYLVFAVLLFLFNFVI